MLPWLAHCVSPFCLGCLGRLSLRACRSSFSRFLLAKDRIVLGDASWQLGLSLLILGCFFLPDVGLGLCMKWVRTAEFFSPTIDYFCFHFFQSYLQVQETRLPFFRDIHICNLTIALIMEDSCVTKGITKF